MKKFLSSLVFAAAASLSLFGASTEVEARTVRCNESPSGYCDLRPVSGAQQRTVRRPNTAQRPVARRPVATRQAPVNRAAAPTPNGGISEWGDGRQMFRIANTPAGFKLNRVDDPAKSAQCAAPRQLVRTDVCKKNPDGTITCKLDCQ